MSLTKCPECGGFVSTLSRSCPHCGYSMHGNGPKKPSYSSHNSPYFKQNASAYTGSRIIADSRNPKGRPAIVCPVCGSSQISMETKDSIPDFDFVGSKKTVLRCACCFHEWNA